MAVMQRDDAKCKNGPERHPDEGFVIFVSPGRHGRRIYCEQSIGSTQRPGAAPEDMNKSSRA
jgi:hypothetical protein